MRRKTCKIWQIEKNTSQCFRFVLLFQIFNLYFIFRLFFQPIAHCIGVSISRQKKKYLRETFCSKKFVAYWLRSFEILIFEHNFTSSSFDLIQLRVQFVPPFVDAFQITHTHTHALKWIVSYQWATVHV
jgi:hypothetical protein